MKRPHGLRYEKWAEGEPLLDVKGTIRTVPENYYVADVSYGGKLVFQGIEAMTRDIDKKHVNKWWQGELEKNWVS
jgi:hypothetical protein